MAEFYTGVYGDHAKGEDTVSDDYFRARKEEKEAMGDFDAKIAAEWGAIAMEADPRKIDLMQKAGILAAKEARFVGVDIKGWEPEE